MHPHAPDLGGGHQLTLELGPIASTAPPDTRALIDLELVVCQLCTGRHPVERCPRRRVCPLCTGDHLAAEHPRSSAE